MGSKAKLRLCLLGITLFLATVSVGLGDESESLSSSRVGADNGCVNRCEELKGNAEEFAACHKGCEANQRVSPRTEYVVCRLRCQVAEQGPEQQRRCQQLCEERLREREQGEGRDEKDKRRDPEREREEQRRREHEREERRRREREREHERGRGRNDEEDENQRDPDWRREQERREQERRRREQERRERERRGEKDDEDENQRDPEWWKEQERREQERRRREQERRERERRGERDDEDENQRDPEWRREQERRRREQERRERERRGERDDEDENQRDPEWRREQERREQERCRREQEQRRREQERRERERRGQRDDEDENDENQRDPDWRREQERREQERRRREQERRERERRGERDEDENQRDPDWRREQERRRREQEQREREWEREHGRGRGRDENQRGGRGREEQRREQERRERERQHGGRGSANQVEIRRTELEQSHNPYYFPEYRFQSRFKSDEGHWRVLERFSERSELLRGIKNQRFAILEARPQTFIIPHHLDGDTVFLVVRGRAALTTIVQEKRETRKESYNLECGDVMTVPAGTTIYFANHENEDLQIVKLIQPVNNPGEFKDYLSAGGESQAYYSVFSNDVLEAALNIPRDRLERIFKQQGEIRGGKIIRASQEQLRALSQRATSVRRGSRGIRAPIKLESQTPVYRNQYGQMFEACPDEFPQLRRNDVAASVLEIKQGGMMVPHFNSRATWVVLVSEGAGSFEMGCPHLQGGQWQERGRREEERHWRREEEEEREGRSGRIEKVAGRLSTGGVLVIPAGHPIAIMASPNQNLRLVGFGINAENNRRNFLAGKENIMNEVDREAKELAFHVEGKQVDEIFRSQRESFFTEGPEGGRLRSTERSPLQSILNLAGYF